ncbi:MAG: DUF5110 domain-containing protein [Anaerolineae bacterium]
MWVPEGTWIEYTTKETFTGPGWVRLVGDLSRVPMLMRAGAILPLAAPFEIDSPTHLASGTTEAIPRDRLVLSVFPGMQGRFRLYEDDGLSMAYREGEAEWTEITTRMDDPETWVVHIAPVEGRCGALPDRRGYEIRLEGSRPPERVMLNGQELTDWQHDPEALRTTIRLSPRDKGTPVMVTAVAGGGISALGQAHDRPLILADVQRLLGKRHPSGVNPEGLLEALLQAEAPEPAPTAARVRDAIARLGGPVVSILEFTTPEEASLQLGRVIAGAPARPDEPFDLKVTWTLWQGQEVTRRTVRKRRVTDSQLVDAPFAFDGQVRTMRWAAEAEVAWRGRKLVSTHQSQPLFPTIYAWQAVVYDVEKEPLALEQVVEGEGRPAAHLDWKPYLQTSDGLKNVNEPHGALFSREYGEALRGGTPLAAYAVTTVTSPDEREAVVRFRAGGAVRFALNGQEVEEVPVEQEGWLPGLLRKARRTAIVRLRPGRNLLIAHSRPPLEQGSRWYLGGWFATAEGELMTDLTFETDVS